MQGARRAAPFFSNNCIVYRRYLKLYAGHFHFSFSPSARRIRYVYTGWKLETKLPKKPNIHADKEKNFYSHEKKERKFALIVLLLISLLTLTLFYFLIVFFALYLFPTLSFLTLSLLGSQRGCFTRTSISCSSPCISLFSLTNYTYVPTYYVQSYAYTWNKLGVTLV